MAGDALGLLGTVVGELRFDELVDEGGFGYIYRGEHLGLEVPVAIKCLKVKQGDPSLALSFEKRFKDETKIAYRLSQGNLDIVRSIGSGTLQTKDGANVPYMVLEWLDGQTLTMELMDRRDSMTPQMPLAEAVALLDSAAHAIAFAHSQGVVHRDIKPGNLFLAKTRTGPRLKVLDFGLAKIIDPEGFMAPSGAATGSNVFIASPSYGAPEQFSKKNGSIGPWTDVYSLSLVLLEMMAGRKVRPADNLVEGMMKALSPDTASPTPRKLGLDVPDAVENVFRRATVLHAEARYKDVSELWSALHDALNEAPRARDGLKTIVTKDAPALYEDVATLKDHKLPDFQKTVGLGERPPLPSSPSQEEKGQGFGATQRLAADMLPPPRRLAPTPTPPPVTVTRDPTVPLAANHPMAPRAPLGSDPRLGFAPPPSSQPLRPPPSSGVPGSGRSKTASFPLWIALAIAAVLGAFGAFAIVYAIAQTRHTK